ncbi:MAG: hypothetical protein AAF430_00525 [Myxococcota bacterium]
MKALAALSLMLTLAVPAAAADSPWAGYLDYAYVYSSADADALRSRLSQYGNEAGIRLEDYIPVAFGPGAIEAAPDPETSMRRAAIAQLLLYLATGEPDHLDDSVDTIVQLSDRLERHENRYWYHYILAHRALERDQRFDFVGEMLDLWLHVIVPLETPYDTLRTLSLSDSPNSGFVAALPYLYENLSRLVLIRSQQMGVDRDLDPLAAIVRLLHDGRVGAHPDVIPVELSSRAYLDRIVSRLDGTESDAGSLTFTLALFEASKYHDEARSMLAERGLEAETIKAMRVASGAYEAALDRAVTLQGQAAVYTRVLRQLGEVYAAKQRLGVDPEIDTPFSIEGAIDVYGELKEGDDLREMGYDGKEDYLASMHGLWEEIQETSLNAADYYLTRAVEKPHLADDYARSAARIYARYLSLFQRYAVPSERETLPDSAYFAAYEAARGYGDSLLTYARGRLSRAEMRQATRRYVAALRLFPFDRQLWPSLASSLERQGQENSYLDLARPVAEGVTSSRHVDSWIQKGEASAAQIAVLRRALADSQVLVYLGFAEESTVAELEDSLTSLRTQHERAENDLIELAARRDRLGRDVGPAAPDPDAEFQVSGDPVDALQVENLDRKIEQTKRSLLRMEKQIEARTSALPLFKATLGTEAMVEELRARRDHPVHTLLRRMYHENRP